MEKEKRYRLLKDTPRNKAGSVFVKYLNNSICDLYDCHGETHSEIFIKDRPDWFELIEDKIVVNFIPDMCESANPEFKRGIISFSSKVSKDKLDSIKNAIENCLNTEKEIKMPETKTMTAEEHQLFIKKDAERMKHKYGLFCNSSVRMYSEKELLEAEERAFYAGYQVINLDEPRPSGLWRVHKYQSFSDYKNSTK